MATGTRMGAPGVDRAPAVSGVGGCGGGRPGRRRRSRLSSAEAASRSARFEPSRLVGEAPPALLLPAVADEHRAGAAEPGAVTKQELKTRTGVGPLSKRQVPQARVVRDGPVTSTWRSSGRSFRVVRDHQEPSGSRWTVLTSRST